MNIFQQPSPEASLAEIMAYFVGAREYLLNADNPNESSDDGRNLLTVGLTLCSDENFIPHVLKLLDRGADPNQPSPYVVFSLAIATTSSISLIERLIDSGLKLNEVVELTEEQAVFTPEKTALLDFVRAVQTYLGGDEVNSIAKKHAGGLGPRRRFVAEVIELLDERGAKRLVDLT